jgi:hypothetical protein
MYMHVYVCICMYVFVHLYVDIQAVYNFVDMQQLDD